MSSHLDQKVKGQAHRGVLIITANSVLHRRL